MKHINIHQVNPHGRMHRPAFTLVEMLVAIGAVALVSVGLAAVFQTVGRTVTTGKRVSALTQQAAVLESQMREDFKNMSREGFLLIRHQFTLGRANNGQRPITVQRFAKDPQTARPRRIDEILFFANGEFRTQRENLIPGRTAQSRAARIYYGHGQKATPRTPQEQQNNQVDVKYLNPTFADWFRDSDSISTRLGEFNTLTEVNRYASSWNLVRQATLLSRPTTVTDGGWPEDRPRPQNWDQYATAGLSLNNLCSDSTFQIAGQPAANSIFRSINEMLPMVSQWSPPAQVKKFAFFWDDQVKVGTNANPRASSGVVDIAATDLDEIAMIVNGSRYSPGDMSNNGEEYFSSRTSGVGILEAPMPLMLGWQKDPTRYGFYPSSYVVAAQSNNTAALNTTAARMQGWMVNALPVPSGYSPTVYSQDQNVISSGDGVKDRLGYRIRCEDDLPDIRGTMDKPTGRAVQTWRTDLLKVGSSKIAAHCTEFVVEWSWGQTYPVNAGYKNEFNEDVGGQTIWYGRTLVGYGSGGASFTTSSAAGAANPDIYRYDPLATYGGISGLSSADGRQLVPPRASPAYKPYKGSPDYVSGSKVDDYTVPDWLIHGVTKWRPSGLDQSSLISYFGYFDPTYTQEDLTQPPSIPWAWPKMVRVTITLADASDPSIEQTFQYVFDLPPDPKP